MVIGLAAVGRGPAKTVHCPSGIIEKRARQMARNHQSSARTRERESSGASGCEGPRAIRSASPRLPFGRATGAQTCESSAQYT